MISTRRRFLKSLALGTPAGIALRPLFARAIATPSEKLPPVRQITRGSKFHWFGYYDKYQFSTDNRLVLGNEVDFEGRSPKAEDSIRVGVVDLADRDRWIELGSTGAWNWQQGCMLQWVPGANDKVVWNDREGGQFVARILEVKKKKLSTLPHPIYTISPDGKTAIAPDFRRLNDCRPGYGYAGVTDPNRDRSAPDDAGIWRMDMKSGRQKLLFSFADAASVPFTGRKESAFLPGAKHWFNHLLFNTDGSRFFFLHRWRNAGQPMTIFQTRAFTCNREGKDWFCIDPYGATSHFIWRDPEHIMAWAWHPSHGDRFYLYKDKSSAVEVVGLDDMTQNGHNTYLPGTNNQWVLNDTYPDKERYQHPYLYHPASRRKMALGHFRTPTEYAGEWRCDTHPRASRDGKLVCIDSPHEGGRQMFLIDLKGLVNGWKE
jgi:hypothetical protein